MLKFALIGTLLGALVAPTLADAKSFERMFPNYRPESREDYNFLRGLDYKQGKVRIDGANAVLTVGRGFYFLDEKDARRVIEDNWGNAPDPGTKGMIFPAGKTPLDYTWGAEITYEAIGYISDKDASSIVSPELLQTLKDDQVAVNAEMRSKGYQGMELIGWASPPRYDSAARKLHWAQELKRDGDDYNTVNYNIRALGRRGVLMTNFIADMDLFPSIKIAAPRVMKMTEFEPGARYTDFNPSIDKAAAIGIGGLITGKLLMKSGFLLLFKKFWFLALLPLLWFGRMLFDD